MKRPRTARNFACAVTPMHEVGQAMGEGAVDLSNGRGTATTTGKVDYEGQVNRGRASRARERAHVHGM